MTFEIPRPSCVYNGWYKIKSTKGFGFGNQKIHYFFNSRISLCGVAKDPTNVLIKCENVLFKRCILCTKQLTRYNDLNNMIQREKSV